MQDRVAENDVEEIPGVGQRENILRGKVQPVPRGFVPDGASENAKAGYGMIEGVHVAVRSVRTVDQAVSQRTMTACEVQKGLFVQGAFWGERAEEARDLLDTTLLLLRRKHLIRLVLLVEGSGFGIELHVQKGDTVFVDEVMSLALTA